MEALKRSRIPTRFLGKENPEVIKTVDYFKKTTRTRSTTSVQRTLEVPSQRARISSYNGPSLPEKKAKFAAHGSRIDKKPVSGRAPLADVAKNTVKSFTSSKATVQQNIRVITTFAQKTGQAESKHTFTSKHTSEISNYQSNDCQATLPAFDNNECFVNKGAEGILDQTISPIDRQKVTVRKNLTPYPKAVNPYNGDDSSSDEIFVNASSHYINVKHPANDEKVVKKKSVFANSFSSGKFMSPIKPNMFTSEITVIVQGIPHDVKCLAKKKSLSHKAHSTGTRHVKINAFCLDIYNTEYLEDIIWHQLKNDGKIVIKKNTLQVYNSFTLPRTAVVNWLIKAQDYLGQPPAVLFTTIRMLDAVLGSMHVPRNMLQLLGLVILWINSKIEDSVNTLPASKMVALCNGAYTVRQFLRMEEKLLVFFGFDLKIPDVTLFVTFYLRNLNSENDLLLNSVHYILECSMLNVEFSTVAPSMQAAAAVCLAMDIFHPAKNEWGKLKGTLGFYKKRELENVMKKMLEDLHKVQDPGYAYRQAYEKYTVQEKLQASIVLLRKLVAT